VATGDDGAPLVLIGPVVGAPQDASRPLVALVFGAPFRQSGHGRVEAGVEVRRRDRVE